MEFEYRVVWKREGLGQKIKVFQTIKAAKRYVSLLSGDEPWKAFGFSGDSFVCCSGSECGCGGLRVKESFENKMKGLPKLLFVRMDYRKVGEWSENQKVVLQ